MVYVMFAGHADMIVHPEFLQRTLGHFYTQAEAGHWLLKDKTAFLQTPQVVIGHVFTHSM
jgi:hypothetical protein